MSFLTGDRKAIGRAFCKPSSSIYFLVATRGELIKLRMLMRPKHPLDRLLILKASGLHHLMGSFIAQPAEEMPGDIGMPDTLKDPAKNVVVKEPLIAGSRETPNGPESCPRCSSRKTSGTPD
jgi:hypothetical protein